MFCLCNKNQTHVPTSAEKLELMENGLGEKRIAFAVRRPLPTIDNPKLYITHIV